MTPIPIPADERREQFKLDVKEALTDRGRHEDWTDIDDAMLDGIADLAEALAKADAILASEPTTVANYDTGLSSPQPPAYRAEAALFDLLEGLAAAVEATRGKDAANRLRSSFARDTSGFDVPFAVQTIGALLASVAAREDAEERQLGQTIDQRDAAEEALSQAFYLVTGRSPEWSNVFGHAEALEEIKDACSLLRQAAKATPPSPGDPHAG